MATCPFAGEADSSLDPLEGWDALDRESPVLLGLASVSGSPSASSHVVTNRKKRGRTKDGLAGNGDTQRESDKLGFLPLAEWDEYNSYEEETPSRLRYSIEWKVAVNNKVICKDTEQDLVLAPAVH
ncbi:hypothetical protein BS50DRAFT_510197, partial [Corynespora cassiicola Philippines]